MKQQERFGSSTFLRLTSMSAPMMRALEARGVIQPLRSDRGWRLFSQQDVTAALAFRREQQRQRCDVGGRAARG